MRITSNNKLSLKGRRKPAFIFSANTLDTGAAAGNAVLGAACALAGTARYGKVYLVGGSVRDLIANKAHAKDYDFVVGKNPSGFIEAVSKKLGASCFPLDYETQTFRAVKSRGKSKFVADASLLRKNIMYDLGKRDFTINAMALDMSELGGEAILIDPFGGLKDLKNLTVRSLNKDVFDDDPLRILRAFRFAQTCGMRIDAPTLTLIKRKRRLVGLPSVERVREELLCMFSSPGSGDSLERMFDARVFDYVFPELSSWRLSKGYDIFGHSLRVVRRAEEFLVKAPLYKKHSWLKEFFAGEACAGISYAALLKISAFLHDAGKPSTMRKIDGTLRFIGHDLAGEKIVNVMLKRLRFPGKAVRFVSRVTANHHRVFVLSGLEKRSKRAYAHFFNAVEKGSLEGVGVLLLCLALCDALATRSKADKRLLATVIDGLSFHRQRSKRRKSPPLLDGNEIMRHFGISEGPLIGEIMRELATLIESGEVSTKAGAIAALRKMFSFLIKN